MIMLTFSAGSNLKWVWCTGLKQTHPGTSTVSRTAGLLKAAVSKRSRSFNPQQNTAHFPKLSSQHGTLHHLPSYIHIQFALFVSLYSEGKKYKEYHNFAFCTQRFIHQLLKVKHQQWQHQSWHSFITHHTMTTCPWSRIPESTWDAACWSVAQEQNVNGGDPAGIWVSAKIKWTSTHGRPWWYSAAGGGAVKFPEVSQRPVLRKKKSCNAENDITTTGWMVWILPLSHAVSHTIRLMWENFIEKCMANYSITLMSLNINTKL